MANRSRGRWIALVVLAPLCAWLVYRNLLAPGEQRAAASLPRLESAGGEAVLGPNRRGGTARPALAASAQERDQQGGALSRQQLTALDPTLRLDLLEKSRQVKYAGSSRNIFEVYTPPPPPPQPVANPADSVPATPSEPPPPPAPTIPLKFYGTAVPPGSMQKKAFLTDGEEIFIGQEGDVIAKFYKIIRIGVNSIELEDSRSKQREQLPLQEE